MHPPLRFPRFRWPLRGPFGWSGVCWLPLGFGLSCLFWGSPCVSPGCLLFAVGLFVPGGGRALEWFVVGAACCWRGRFWLLALLLLLPQLLCAVYLGAVQFKVYTLLPSLEEFSAIPPSKPQRVIMRWSFNLWCRHGKNCEIKFPFFSTSGLAFIKGPCEAGGW